MSELWKIIGNLCRCCHSEGSSFTSFSAATSDWDGGMVYSDMMKICFDINLPHVQGPLGPPTYMICKQCIKKLKEATLFKKQVLKCEERFMSVYNKNVIVADCTSSEDLDLKKEDQVSYTEELQENGEESEDNWLSDEDFKNDSVDEELNKLLEKPKTEQEKEVDVGAKDRNKSKFHLRPSDFKETDNGYICTHCDKKYNQRNSLVTHVKVKHYQVPEYICPACGNGFMTATSLTIHKLEEHRIDERLKCNACPSMFNSKLQLKNHKNSFHMLGMKYKCELCDYESFNSTSLYKHKAKHKKVKDNICKYCKKAFLRRATLLLHERIHTGDRRKVCQVCNQAFVQKASLNYHMTKYHPGIDI